ncbi:MAG: M1 family metallopeptidase [Cyanobacteriota bacterium ELA615]
MAKNIYYDDEGAKSFFLPDSKPHYNPDSPGQVNHIFLDIELDVEREYLAGTCTIKLTPVRGGIKDLILDAVDLEIQAVTIDKLAVPFSYDGKELKINLLQPTSDSTIELAIKYQVFQPQRGIYFIKPNSDYPDKPTQIWTQGEDEDSRFWFPCFDYPGQLASSEIKVKVPKPLIAVSNGDLINSEDLGESTIYHWLQRDIHPTYLMTLAVGNFAQIEDKWRDIPITYYVEKGREDQALLSMGKTPRMVEFYSQKFGYRYPFSKYAQVCVDDFIFGGMENTSTTILMDRCLLDQRASLDNLRTETLVAHELAHQWFGDLVVIKHWSHAWIKEGMATYSEVLWIEAEYGQQESAYYRLGDIRNYLHEDSSRYRRPIVTNVYREAIELYDRHLYEKGGCVYHMIRSILGDELFEKSIANFVNTYAHRTVETIDLLRTIESTTGYNLQPLFDQYVFRGGHPEFEVEYSWDQENNLAKLTVKQTQQDLFDLKIPLGFGYIDQKMKIFNLRFYQKEQTFYLPIEQKPEFISFDLGNNYLKTVTLKYPLNELKAQLKYDNDPIARTFAAAALGKMGTMAVLEIFKEALSSESFWGVRLEIVKQLGKIQLNAVEEILQGALADSNPKVRKEVLAQLSKFKNSQTFNIFKDYLAKGDPSYYTEAAIAQNLGSLATATFQEKQPEVIELLQDVLKNRAGWNEVVRAGAIAGLSELKNNPKAVEIILEYTKAGVPQPLRLAAIRSLGPVSLAQKESELEMIAEQLQNLAKEPFFLTQVAVCSAAGQMQTPSAITILESLAGQTLDGRVARIAQEAISKVQAALGTEKGLDQLREKLDKITEENKDLKSRLAALEAKLDSKENSK